MNRVIVALLSVKAFSKVCTKDFLSSSLASDLTMNIISYFFILTPPYGLSALYEQGAFAHEVL